jgi:tyrosine-protein phosphatase non-receptor type 23
LHNIQCIAEYYAEDPESYAREFKDLEELRGLATCRPRITNECCSTIKRYYSQLHSLQNRFPLSSESELLNFSWKDIYSGSVWNTSNVKYEMASILYNVAAIHSKLGVDEERNDPESMKLACTHFQCAAWAFSEMKNLYSLQLKGDLSVELMIFMQQICFAQAQECILEKSLADNRKAAIIAKVTAQVISFYNAAMSALFSQNEDGSIQELIGNKLYKEWLKYIKFKISYLSSVLFLYQGQHSEEQRKMGERLALYNAACDKLEEAKKESKGMNKIETINEAMVLATDIIEGKRKNAKQENEFIYHEAIPELSSISAVQGANLVQGIPFEVTDPQVIGEDIFKRLVPMKTHENLSLYSEEKANILRRLGTKIDERDAELASFMGSLNMDVLNSMKHSQEKLPQNLVDRCAELSAKPNAIPDLVESMSSLANICTDVEFSLNEIKRILDEENKQESEFQKQMGKRPTGHMTELTREFTKYFDAHSKAGESNDTLRKAMELHVNNLRILAQPLASLKLQVPQSEPIDEIVRKELESLLNKVEEMKTQRDAIYEELRDQILNKDDITSQLIAYGDKDVDELFKKELKKYSQSVNIIEQNLVAQGNILKALTDTYAKHAMSLKAFNDIKSKRDQFYSGLIGSFDVYEDLMSKSVKGLDFYKKLHGNIQKLLSRVKAAKDVQDEERQQLLKKITPKAPVETVKPDMTYKSNAYISNTSGIGEFH